MTAIEQLRGDPRALDRLNQFLTEDAVGVLFLKALTEKVLGLVPIGHDQANHGTIFRSGVSSGANAVLTFVTELDPVKVAEKRAQELADSRLKEKSMLPSQRIAMMQRTQPDKAPTFNIPRPIVTESIPE